MSNDTALLVIDVQLGIFQEETPLFNAEQLLANINDLIGRARANGIPVIFIQHNGAEGDSLHPSQPGYAIHPALVPLPGEAVIAKDFGNAFKKTPLQALLQEKGITKLVVTGLVAQYCVKATWRGALKLGYQVTLVADAQSTFAQKRPTAPKIIERLNRAIVEAGGQLKTTAQVTFEE